MAIVSASDASGSAGLPYQRTFSQSVTPPFDFGNKYISSNKKINLDPSDKWHDKEKYMSAAKKLNQLFNNNISAYN